MNAPASALTIVERVDQSQAIALLQQRAERFLPFLPGATEQAKHEAFDRMRQGVAVAMVKNPDLLGCTPESLFLASLEAVSQGLQPTGASGGAHLVPYRSGSDKVAQLIPDYRGVVRLITGPGSEVLSVEANVVKEVDEFDYQLGTEASITHVPSLEPDRSASPTTHAYAVFRLRSAGQVVDVMDRTAIERIRNRSRSGVQGPWATDWDEMAKKTVVKRGSKLCPVRPDVRAILVREDELAGDGDADPTVESAPTGPTRAATLGSRIRRARNVTPAETPAGTDAGTTSEGEFTEQESPAGMTKDDLRAVLDELHVHPDYAIQVAKRLNPDRDPSTELTPEQRVGVANELRAEAAAAADAANSL